MFPWTSWLFLERMRVFVSAALDWDRWWIVVGVAVCVDVYICVFVPVFVELK